MSNKQAPLTTPLHLLLQLSRNLLEHLEQACTEALENAEQMLARLERQRSKTQEQLYKANTRLSDAVHAGKTGRQAKYRARISELDELLATLEARHAELLAYLQQLRIDSGESLELAQGIGKVAASAASRLKRRELTREADRAGERVRPSAAPAALAPPKAVRRSARSAIPAPVHAGPETELPKASRTRRGRKPVTAQD